MQSLHYNSSQIKNSIIICIYFCYYFSHVHITKETMCSLKNQYNLELYKNMKLNDTTYFVTSRKNITDCPLQYSLNSVTGSYVMEMTDSPTPSECITISDAFSFDIENTTRASISSANCKCYNPAQSTAIKLYTRTT